MSHTNSETEKGKNSKKCGAIHTGEEGFSDFKLTVIIDGEGNKMCIMKEKRLLVILRKTEYRQLSEKPF